MAQSRKTIFSLGGPTYLDDPRVAEAQRAQALRLQEEAQNASLERAALEASAAVERAQIDAQSRLRDAMLREQGWTDRARMQQAGENERARMGREDAQASRNDQLQLGYDRLAQDALLAQQSEAGREQARRADLLRAALNALSNENRQPDPAMVAGTAADYEKRIQDALASGWDPESGAMVEGLLGQYGAAAGQLGPSAEAGYRDLARRIGQQAADAQAQAGYSTPFLRAAVEAPSDIQNWAVDKAASAANVFGIPTGGLALLRASPPPIAGRLGERTPRDVGAGAVMQRAAALQDLGPIEPRLDPRTRMAQAIFQQLAGE